MALHPQTKSVPLFGGIDTKTDPKFVAWNKQISAENVQFFGVARARKRYGQTALSQAVGFSGQTISVGKAIGSYGNELLVYDGSALYAYAPGQGAWLSRGPLQEVIVSKTSIVRTAGSVGGLSNARTANAEVYAWKDSRGGAYWAARDPSSGTFLQTPTLLDTGGYNPHVVAIGAYVYIFYGTAGNLLKAAQISAINPAAGIAFTFILSTDYDSTAPIGVGATATRIMLAWPSATTLGSWYVSAYDSMLNLQTGTIAAGTVTSPTFAHIAYSTDETWAMLSVVDADTEAQFIPILVSTGAADWGSAHDNPGALVHHAASVGVGSNTFVIYNDFEYGTSMPRVESSLSTLGVGTQSVASIGSLYGVQMASLPVLSSGTIYMVTMSPLVNLGLSTSQQGAFYLCSGTSSTKLAIIQRFMGEQAYQTGFVLPSLEVVTSSKLFTALTEQTALRADATGTIFTQSGLASAYFEFPSSSGVQFTSFGTNCLINCGNTYVYDGSQLVESGFWEFPDGITTSVASGGLLNQGTYAYQVTYEWVDATGNTHYSAPSYPVVVATPNAGQDNKVTITVPYTALTLKSDATVNIYRTATAPGVSVTQDTGIGPWFKIYSTPNLRDGTASFSYVDSASDASVQGTQFLYAPSDGSGELEDFAPPPFLYMVATKTRMFGIAQDDRTALWYSKPLVPGRSAEFTPLQVVRIETDGGSVTGLGHIDTQAVVFKTRRVYYLPGDGPNAAGQGTFFPALQLISSTSGCTNNSSVLSMHDGVFFKSQVGLQLLNRSLSMDAGIGLAVQGFNNLTLTGAIPAPDQNQLRWTSSDGTALVYDYVTQRWVTYTGYDAVGYTEWNGTYARLRPNGQVLYEDQTTYLDNLQPVRMLIETAWLKPAELAQGFAAVWYAEILGEYQSSHQLMVEIAYDYTDVPRQASSWSAPTSTSTYGSGSPYGSDVVFGSNLITNTAQYQLRVALQRQVCESVKFKIYDTAITGQSCDLNEITLQLGVIGGLNRVPAAQQV